ncbi:hypothetical protein GJ744_007320 [Endocarpon pusillum]|uniref:Uncharacterized protein n=1 Tax=Endocarpon pusillum TaxID=364733 RepID=A0A8H7AN38_9EURO|nr:hypothetical protein GJ744_007320 [Endocarpon pusillum]
MIWEGISVESWIELHLLTTWVEMWLVCWQTERGERPMQDRTGRKTIGVLYLGQGGSALPDWALLPDQSMESK